MNLVSAHSDFSLSFSFFLFFPSSQKDSASLSPLLLTLQLLFVPRYSNQRMYFMTQFKVKRLTFNLNPSLTRWTYSNLKLNCRFHSQSWLLTLWSVEKRMWSLRENFENDCKVLKSNKFHQGFSLMNIFHECVGEIRWNRNETDRNFL